MGCKVEVQREDAPFKGRAETSLSGTIPLTVDNLECDILVRWTGMEAKDAEIIRICRLQKELRSFCGIHQIGVKDVELVSLHDFGRRLRNVKCKKW